MRFSSLLDPHPTIPPWQDKAFTVPAHQTPVLCRQTNLCRHGNLSGQVHISLSQSRVSMESLSCMKKEHLNTLCRYAPDFCIHLLPHFSVRQNALVLNEISFSTSQYPQTIFGYVQLGVGNGSCLPEEYQSNGRKQGYRKKC